MENGNKLLKVVICGKYINLNKISKKLTQTSFYYSLQYTMQNRETCRLNKCFNMERSKGIFVRKKSKEIASLMKMRSTLNVL